MEGAGVPTVQAHLNADHGCSVYKVSEPQYTERVEMSEEEGQDEALRPLANIDSTCCHVSVDNSFHLKYSFVTREGEQRQLTMRENSRKRLLFIFTGS